MLKQAAFNADVPALALDSAHSVAFHTGLGAPMYPVPSSQCQKYLNEEYIASYADVAYTKPNIVVVADGASPDSLAKWTGQFFKDLPAKPASGQNLKVEPTKYYGGEQRLHSKSGNSMVVAFPGFDMASAKPDMAVLAALLGGQTTVKWAPGYSLLSKATAGYSGLSVSTKNFAYSDAGLFAIQLSGNPASIRKASSDVVKTLESVANGSVSKEDLTKAIANAKFDALDQFQLRGPSMLLAGAGLLHNAQAFSLENLAKGIEGVTASTLKTVSRAPLPHVRIQNTNNPYRLPRLSWMEEPPYLQLAISLCCLTLMRLAFGYRRKIRYVEACTNREIN